MGTSGSSSGPGGGTPLVPSWLGGGGAAGGGSGAGPGGGEGAAPDAGSDGASGPDAGEEGGPEEHAPEPSPAASPAPARPIPAAASPKRFTPIRASLTRYARSGGRDGRALRRGISSYVRSGAGGARRAATRMGASRSAGVGLVSFLNDSRTSGTTQALARLNLQHLAGRPSAEILESVAEVICPPGGPVDQGVARNAMFETVADLATAGLDFEDMTPAQIEFALEMFATRAIEGRILNDVANKTIRVAGRREDLIRAQEGMHDLIRGAVRDAVHEAGGVDSLTDAKTAEFVAKVYELAFQYLESEE